MNNSTSKKLGELRGQKKDKSRIKQSKRKVRYTAKKESHISPNEVEKPSKRAKKIVLAQYPMAKVERDGAMFFVYIGKGSKRQDLGAGFSKEGAWCSAGCSLWIGS